MIDVVSVVVVILIATLGARYVEKDNDEKRHSVFCLGICTHLEQKQEGLKDPNEPAPEGQQQENDNE
jgi:hypothetical protein